MRAENGGARRRRGGHAPRARALRSSCASGCRRSPRWSGRSPTSACARSARSAATSASPIRTRIRRRSCSRSTRKSSAGGAASRRGALPIGDFVVGPYQTSLGEGELLTAVHVPRLPAAHGSPTRSSRSTSGPTATVACLARVEDGVHRRGARRRRLGRREARALGRCRGAARGHAGRRARPRCRPRRR